MSRPGRGPAGCGPGKRPRGPTRDQLAAAEGVHVPDVIGPGLRVLFCGINPGLYSGAVGHHFARPGNRFWKALHAAGFTDRVLSPAEEALLLEHGLGITNLVRRATATARDIAPHELREGAARLRRLVRRYRPAFIAFLGISAYRTAFARPDSLVGPQMETLSGSRTWLLPNPSGLNARYQVADLAEAFGALRAEVGVSVARDR
jgi:TDG/mug DNA glycosylase family protein